MNEKALSANWRWASVGELGDVSGGVTKNSAKTNLPIKLPYLRVANVYANELRLDDIAEIGVTQAESVRALLVKGDLLVVEGNGSVDQIGRVALWNGTISPCLHQNHLIKVRCGITDLGPFVLYWLLSSKGREQVVRAASSTSGLHTLSLSKVANLPAPIAPLPEQQRIVEAIESYFTRLDDAVTTLERVQRNLKRYRASVLKAAVEGRLVPTEAELARAEGRDYEHASVLLERILAERRRRWHEANGRGEYQEPATAATSDLRELPKGWCWATVDQLSYEVRYGSSTKTHEAPEGGVPVVRMGNIVDGFLDLTDLKYLLAGHDEFPDLLLQPGDLLFNRTNSAELVGKTAVFHGQREPCSFASYLIRVRMLQGVHPDFVSHYINSSAGRAWITSVVSQQVGQANVNGTKLRACPVPLPSSHEQRRIVGEVDRLLSMAFATVEGATANHRRCQRLRQSILKWAFEGKLADQDPSDEPASVLLERIRSETLAGRANGRNTEDTRLRRGSRRKFARAGKKP